MRNWNNGTYPTSGLKWMDHVLFVLSNQSRYNLSVLNFIRPAREERSMVCFWQACSKFDSPIFPVFLYFVFVFWCIFLFGCVLGQELMLCISIVWFQNMGILFGYSTGSRHAWWGGMPYLHDCVILGPFITMVSCHCFIRVEQIVFVTGDIDRTVVVGTLAVPGYSYSLWASDVRTLS